MWRRVRYVLVLVALCAVATCPTAQRSCTARERAREADQLLEYLGDRIAASIAATGKVPEAAAGPTPAASCCDQGGACSADPTAWSAPGWRALAFSIDGEHRYSYSYAPAVGGRAAVVRAVGDLDCDGEPGLYELEVRASASGVERRWTRKEPYE